MKLLVLVPKGVVRRLLKNHVLGQLTNWHGGLHYSCHRQITPVLVSILDIKGSSKIIILDYSLAVEFKFHVP